MVTDRRGLAPLVVLFCVLGSILVLGGGVWFLFYSRILSLPGKESISSETRVTNALRSMMDTSSAAVHLYINVDSAAGTENAVSLTLETTVQNVPMPASKEVLSQQGDVRIDGLLDREPFAAELSFQTAPEKTYVLIRSLMVPQEIFPFPAELLTDGWFYLPAVGQESPLTKLVPAGFTSGCTPTEAAQEQVRSYLSSFSLSDIARIDQTGTASIQEEDATTYHVEMIPGASMAFFQAIADRSGCGQDLLQETDGDWTLTDLSVSVGNRTELIRQIQASFENADGTRIIGTLTFENFNVTEQVDEPTDARSFEELVLDRLQPPTGNGPEESVLNQETALLQEQIDAYQP